MRGLLLPCYVIEVVVVISRLPHSTDSYFHHFDICICQFCVLCCVVFHDKYQIRKYEKTQQGNLLGSDGGDGGDGDAVNGGSTLLRD